MKLTESEELELLELENEEAAAMAAAKDAPTGAGSAMVPGMTQEDADLAASSKTDLALKAAGEALDTPIMESRLVNPLGLPDVLTAAKTGIEDASVDAGKYYAELGVPRIGKAVEAGGKFTAGMIPARMKDALFVAMAGPALEAASAIGKPVARFGGDILADIAGQVAGRSPEALKVIFKKPGALWKKANEVFSLVHQERLVKNIERAMGERGAQFKELENVLTGFSEGAVKSKGRAAVVNTDSVIADVSKEMMRSGFQLPKGIAPKGYVQPRIGRVDVMSPEYKAIIEKMKVLRDTKNMTFGEGLNLRRQLDDMISYGVEGSNGLQPVTSSSQRILHSMRQRINTQLRESVPADLRPAWIKANAEYRRASEAFRELQKQVVKGEPGTTENKLLQLLREGRYDSQVMNRANRINERAAKAFDDMKDHIAARQFKDWAAGGIGKGAFGFLPTSPRIVGMGTSAAGAATQGAGAAAKLAAENPVKSAIATQGLLNAPR